MEVMEDALGIAKSGNRLNYRRLKVFYPGALLCRCLASGPAFLALLDLRQLVRAEVA